MRFEHDQNGTALDDLFVLSNVLEALSVAFSGGEEPVLTRSATTGYAFLLSMCADFAARLADDWAKETSK